MMSQFVIYIGPKIYDLDTNMWNRHMFIECSYVYRNPKNTKIGSGTKHFITFLSLRFFDMRRERYSFFLCWLFHLTPSHAAHFVDPNWSRQGETKNRLPSSRFESQLSRSEFKSQLTVFFFKFQNPQRFWAWCHSRPWSYFLSGVFIVTSVIVTSGPRARVNTCTQCVHLTNPCTKPKGSQPN